MASPGAFADGLIGFANPANLALLHGHELRFFWSTRGAQSISLQNWGVFGGIRRLGFSVQRQEFGGIGVTDFRLSAATGSRRLAYGLAYGWSAGELDALGRAKLAALGTIYRPSKYLSTGLGGSFSLESGDWEGTAEMALRPLGDAKFTLFVDAALQKDTQISDMAWSVGGIWQFEKGFHLLGRYFKSEAFTLGLAIDFGRPGIASQGHFDSGSRHRLSTYMVRLGGAKRSILPTLLDRNKRYLPLALKGRVDYLKYAYFDSGKHRLFEILTNITAAVEDPRISAIAVNLSGLRARPEHAWEIRQALRDAQQKGKKVFAFIDRAGMTTYHLASVADQIVMDPQGSLVLQGYALGRTYFKGTLEKLGLGFDEWRFFKYKSANETYSRDSMSEADREQLQDFVDDWYELTRSEVATSRNFTPADFDAFIDEGGYFGPKAALKAGLVDTLARWSSIDGVIAHVSKKDLRGLAAHALFANSLPNANWGVPPTIAVVYGLGICALDTGIRARWLEQVFLALARQSAVKAVVFRVDSPGGDGMASDLVAEALKQCSKVKPVIVSQGQVAGSGGYWISMYGDTILAGPNTTMGSIGVIGGWVYDKGLSGKLGLSSDLVQRGKHAGLGRGVNLPFLNLQVPARNLTAEERAKAEMNINVLYDDFVRKVAAGRNMSESQVREIAQGHVYSGSRGKEVGLVDELGGLLEAIEIAKERAGIKAGEEFQVIELPRNKGLIDLRGKLSPMPIRTGEDPTLQFIRLLIQQAGGPLPVMTPGTYPDFE